MAQAQSTSHYGIDSGINPAAFTITINSPDNQTAYAKTLSLNFNLTWTAYPVFDFSVAPPVYCYYAYQIDNRAFVDVYWNQSANDHIRQTPKNNFILNPTFTYSVDISDLPDGNHTLTIRESIYDGTNPWLNATTKPITFTVQNSAPQTTPTIPEFQHTLILFPLAAALAIVIVLKIKKEKK